MIDDALDANLVKERLVEVWGERVDPDLVFVDGFHCEFFVSTAHYRRVSGREILRVTILLGVGPESIECWPLGEGLQFFLDADPVTSPEIPTAKAAALRSVPLEPTPVTDPKRRR